VTTSFFANFVPPGTNTANFSNEAGGNVERSYKEAGSAEAGEHVADTVMANDYDEDDLGYYPDGVKRTLTDAQIAIFRHTDTRIDHKYRREGFYALDCKRMTRDISTR